ncbi:hypothetical protein IMSAGC011_03027 [Lachnospiraceae bacterium]|nr:hypothetical protein IMSAGC011_03027 [Lachnospiraceae bacterium]
MLKLHQSSRNESNESQMKKCENCPVGDFHIFYGHSQGYPIGQIYFPIGERNFLDSETECSGNGEVICFAHLWGKTRLVRLVPQRRAIGSNFIDKGIELIEIAVNSLFQVYGL